MQISYPKTGVLCGLALLGLLTGCTTYTTQSSDFRSSWQAGQLPAAATEVAKKAEKNANNQSTVVWSLEEATVYRTQALENAPPATPAGAPSAFALGPAGVANAPSYQESMFNRSIDAFNWAADRIITYDEQAKAKVASEAGAILTNPANLSYRGRPSDRIMLEAYQALNYLALKQPDNARVALNKVLQHQRDALETNAKRIEEAQAKAEEAKEGKIADEKGKAASYDAEQAMQDPRVAATLQEIDTELETDVRPYEVYVNPFAVFVDGLFFMTYGEDASDLERARKSIERVAAMAPESSFIKEDLALAEGLAYGKRPEGLTYVIFETGSAPYLDQIQIPIPLFLVTKKAEYTQCAIPRLKRMPDYVPAAEISVGDRTLQTELLSSMDSVVAREFKNEWPATLTKAIISAGIKGLIQYQVDKQLEKQSYSVQLAGMLATSIYNAATTIADTRSWTTLPKQFQYARFVTPEDRTITITVGTTSRQVTIEPGKVNLVYVKSINPSVPAIVSQTVLR